MTYDITVIIPTFNESDNIAVLVDRLDAALEGQSAELLFVDDSTDATPATIETIANTSSLPIRLVHRSGPFGGLSGAVVDGMRMSDAEWVVVMDGDLQHPPELVPELVDKGRQSAADVVVASRHVPGGSTAGLGGPIRGLVSKASNLLAIAMFPIRLRHCSDPMSGFFAVRTSAVELASLKPQGFKILLEILARNQLHVAEVPLVFGERHAGESKASMREGFRFIRQLATLRFGKMSAFAVIGGIGAIANLVILAMLQHFGMWYLAAAIIAGVVTIIGNFLLQERFVFADLRNGKHSLRGRFVRSFAFNGAETAIRTALLWVIVETTGLHSVLVQAVLIGIGFILRFVYHALVVYRPADVAEPAECAACTASGATALFRDQSD